VTDTAANQLRRILRVIPELADGHAHEIDAIAERAGVDKETLISDLQALASRHGEPGGFVEGMQIFIDHDTIEVTSDHFLRPMGLTIHELCAMELGLSILKAERPPDETAAIERTRNRLRKLIAELPADHDESPMRHAEIAPTAGLPYLAELRKALRDHRKAKITYRKSGSDKPTTRVVRLYALVPASGMWYAVAYCEMCEGLRVFRLDRVEGAEGLPDKYEIPVGFSVTETLQSGKGLRAELTATGMKVRYSPRIARWIAEREGLSLAEDGSLTVEHPLADAEWGIRHVLQYGADAEVLEPNRLREEIVRRLDSMG
jgi:proteasome accessory factor C